MACSSSRDRTAEFRNRVQSLKVQNLNSSNANLRHTTDGSAVVVDREADQFNDIARSIGKDITSTYTKLEKLTLLAKKKTIFDDNRVAVQKLTNVINQDIAHLNKQIGQLQTIAKAQRKGQGKHQAGHTSSILVQLQSKLATMSNNFKQVLDVTTQNLKSQRSRAEQFSRGAVTSSLPESATIGYHKGSVLCIEEDMTAHRGDALIDMGGSQQLATINHDQDHYSSRADAMHTIESTIVELGGIFTQLAAIVKEQEEMVDSIEENVNNVSDNVNLGYKEILKYFQSVSSDRWLMVKIFGVLIFFFLLFIIFMA